MTLEEYRAFLKSIEGMDFLTIEEAAALLRTSRESIYHHIHLGHLPAIPLGERGATWRICRHDLSKLAVCCGEEADRYDKPTKAERQARLPDVR